MAQKITGTFAGTGASDAISCTSAVVVLSFAGTATVNLEVNLTGSTWVAATVESLGSKDITASGVYTWNPEGVNAPIRLNCTAHTNNVTYAVYTR